MLFDGSYLGAYPLDVVINFIPTARCKGIASILTATGIQECIMIRERVENYVCILDELKPIFGIRKQGTHTIRLNHTLMNYEFKKGWCYYILIKEQQSPDFKLNAFLELFFCKDDIYTRFHHINKYTMRTRIDKKHLIVDDLDLMKIRMDEIIDRIDDQWYVLSEHAINELYNTHRDIKTRRY